MTVAAALLLTGGLAMVFGVILCWGLIDVIRTVWEDERAARIREHWAWFVAYVVLIILVPLAIGLYFGQLFVQILVNR